MSGPSLVIIQLFPLFFTIYVTSFGTKAIANFNSIQLARKSWTRQMSLKSSQRKKKRASRTRLIQEHSKNFKMKTSRRKSVDWSHWLSELLTVVSLTIHFKTKMSSLRSTLQSSNSDNIMYPCSFVSSN